MSPEVNQLSTVRFEYPSSEARVSRVRLVALSQSLISSGVMMG